MMQKITILGATGSIGQSTLSVIEQNSERYSVFALTANKSVKLLSEQCRQFKPKYAVVGSELLASDLRELLSLYDCSTEVLFGRQALCDVAGHSDVDTVMAAIVGAAGLLPTLSGVEAGKRILLANKEALVMGGRLFMDKVAEHGALLLPIDSEHNAIFQCLPSSCANLNESGVSKILLTGSGGPFRTRDVDTFDLVTPDEACAHPNWSMGRKISVDSATMMNKGLEFIEACWLFDAKCEDIEVVVHPQSVVHSMVQYRDGSVLAQMGNPDMRTPIAHCLAFPERINSGVKSLDFSSLSELSFESPDFERFPCLSLAMEASTMGEDFPIVLNAVNEIAVDLFIHKQLKFTQIAAVIGSVMESWDSSEPESIAAVIDADHRARIKANEAVKSIQS